MSQRSNTSNRNVRTQSSRNAGTQSSRNVRTQSSRNAGTQSSRNIRTQSKQYDKRMDERREVARRTNAKKTDTQRKGNSKKKVEKEPWFVQGGHPDYQCLFLVVVLVGIGIMMTYSASYYRASILEGDSTYEYVKTQIAAAVLGFGAIFVLTNMNYRRFQSFFILGMLLSIGLSSVVLIMGVATNGAKRWIKIGSITLQPSEIAKIALILFIATMISAKRYLLDEFGSVIKLLIVPVLEIGLIIGENLTSALVCMMIVGGMLFVASKDLRHVGVLAIIGVVVVVVAIMAKGYRGGRFEAWRNPETSEGGYQVMNSLYAIGSGGLFGRGFGKSIQSMGFLPESHNDMIFSVICEEFGLVGGVALLILFAALIYRLKVIASDAQDAFGSLLVTGVMIHIAVQMVINVCVCTNIIPNTGVTLPFVSYGGTSVAITLAEIGIVMSVSRQTKMMTKERVEQKLEEEFEG